MNKSQERFFVYQASRALGVRWDVLEERESPDFLIRERSQTFGLEITEVFNSPTGKKGSKLKEAESINQRTIDFYRELYVERGGPPLSVKILGHADDHTMNDLVESLLSQNLASMRHCEEIKLQISDHVKAYVTKTLRHNWHLIDDRVGWVNQSPIRIIQNSVAKKSESLQAYENAAGPDIRLLLVANRTRASGMLKVKADQMISLDTYGFQVVYFFSYPESVKVFR